MENTPFKLDELINDFYNSVIEVAKTLSTWKEYIINSFIVIPDSLDSNNKPRRLSNGPIEGLNSIIKKYIQTAIVLMIFEDLAFI